MLVLFIVLDPQHQGLTGVTGAIYVVSFPSLTALYAVVGALIAVRQPGNRIAWLYCSFGLTFGVGLVGYVYGGTGLAHPELHLPGLTVAAWLAQCTTAADVLGILSVLCFPDGRTLGGWWRVAGWSMAATAALSVVASLAQPTLDMVTGSIANPLAVNGWLADVLRTVRDATGLVLTPFLVCAGASLVIRYRRGGTELRLQLKWLAFAVSAAMAAFLAGSVLQDVQGSDAGMPADLGFALGYVALAVIPLFTGVAILRYHLYEIDRLINRTIVYGLLTAALGTVYVASVLVLQALLAPLTRGQDVAIAGATLAVAALFGPARGYAQAAVNRRFYRARYDAERTVEAFAGRLRSQIDLDSLVAELLLTVDGTLQPTRATLWLRAPGSGAPARPAAPPPAMVQEGPTR